MNLQVFLWLWSLIICTEERKRAHCSHCCNASSPAQVYGTTWVGHSGASKNGREQELGWKAARSMRTNRNRKSFSEFWKIKNKKCEKLETNGTQQPLPKLSHAHFGIRCFTTTTKKSTLVYIRGFWGHFTMWPTAVSWSQGKLTIPWVLGPLGHGYPSTGIFLYFQILATYFWLDLYILTDFFRTCKY